MSKKIHFLRRVATGLTLLSGLGLFFLLLHAGSAFAIGQQIGEAPAPQAVASLATGSYTLVLDVDQDSWIHSTSPDQNNGSDEEFFCKENGGDMKRPLYRFDLSLLAPGAEILSATAYFYVNDDSPYPVDLHRITSAWDEMTVTWNTFGNAYDPTPAASFIPQPKSAYAGADVTAQVQDWVNGIDDNNGFILLSAVQGDESKLASRENKDSARHPYLVVTVAAQTSVFTPSKDTDIWQTHADRSYGSCDWMAVNLENNDLENALIQFDLSSLPANCTINSATLTMTVHSRSNKNYTFPADIHRITRDWVEDPACEATATTGATWNVSESGVPWTTPGGDFDAAVIDSTAISDSAPVGTVYTWTVTSLVQDWYAGVAENDGLALSSSGANAANKWVSFYTREDATPSNRPHLEVAYSCPANAIGDQVWDDLDRDGVQDAGEPGLSGVRVNAYFGGCGTAVDPPFRTATTDADGHYLLADLAPGDYCVVVDEATLPDDYTTTAGNSPLDVTLVAGEYVTEADFGYANAYADDRLTVSAYSPCTDIAWLQTDAANHGASITNQDFSACTFTLEGAAADMPGLKQEVENDVHSRSVGFDVFTRAAFVPNDPDYNNASLVYGPQQINAEAAWDITTGDPNLIEAVLDTGIDKTHEEFAGRVLPGWDFANDDADPSDDEGHGTHVAGIIAAGIDNGVGMAGIAGNVKILPVKVLNANNTGWWSDVAAGVTWAVDQGAKIINLSLAGTVDSTALQDAIAYAVSKDVLVVVSAGNDGSNALHYPATYDNVLAVGATTFNGDRWSLSNYGSNVDVMAPGSLVWSTYWTSDRTNEYQFMSGTSMAAPHAAGLGALLYSRNPNLTAAKAKATILQTAVDMGDPGVDELHGDGLIDAGAAVASVQAQALTPPANAMAATLLDDVNGNGAVDPGDTVRYSISVGNADVASYTNVVVSDTVPIHTTYAPGSTTLNGIPVLDGGSTAFPLDEGGVNIGAVGPGTTSVVSFDVIIGVPPAFPTIILNQGTVQTDQGAQVVSAEVEVVLSPQLVKTVDKSAAGPGDVLTYGLTVNYPGDALLSGVTITDAIPAGASYVAGSASAGGVESGGVVSWDLGDSAAGVAGYGVSGGWHFRRKLTFDNTAQIENLVDFPVLVRLDNSRIDYSQTQDSGQDLRFYDADGATLLPHEIEKWNESGTSYVWVKVPQVDGSSSADSIWMYYGNPDAADGQDAANVWSANYDAVWHMNETTGTVFDSTINNYDGSPTGITQNSSGPIDGADLFPDGETDHISLPNGCIIPGGSAAWTFETWLNPNAADDFDRLFAQNASGCPDLQLIAHWYEASGQVEVGFDATGAAIVPIAAAPVTSGQWTHFVWVHNGGTDITYVDGVPSSVETRTTNMGTDGPNAIGARNSGDWRNSFDGGLDEMRLSTMARSADWVAAQHLAMTDQFIAYGAEETILGGGNTLSAGPTLITSGNRITVTQVLTQPATAARSGAVDVQITASSDDAEEQVNDRSMYLDSSDLEIVDDVAYNLLQYVGMRFNGISVPQGATITNARITFTAAPSDDPNNNSSAITVTIAGDDTDSASTFTTAASNISDRPLTTTNVSWSPQSWTTGSTYDTPSLKTIVQDIVDRGGWVSGNSMAFIISGSGTRTAYAWDGGSTKAPILHITWETPSTTPPDPVSPSLIFTGTNGVSATLISGPTPASATVGPAGTAFTWVYQVSDNGQIGHLTFGGDATDGTKTWAWAESNSVIVAPPLTFQVTVDDPASVGAVQNRAFIQSDGGFPHTPSNAAVTVLTGSIGDLVWDDADGDAIQYPVEPGIANAVVELTDSTGAILTTNTASDGSYSFAGLVAGTYTITLDSGSTSLDFNQVTTPYPRVVHLRTGEDYLAADIGLNRQAMSIGDTIWYDGDGDGRQDIAEPGIGNVTIDLYLDDGDGVFEPTPALGSDAFVDSTVSDANGVYRMDIPVAGTYFVDVTDDYGILTGLSHTVGEHSLTDPSPAIAIAPGQVYQGADFGYVRVPAAGNAIIGDRVWVDGNSNGRREEAEPVIINVEVCATPGDICTLTDLNGRYLLEVPAGDYQVGPTSDPLGMTPALLSAQSAKPVSVQAGEQRLDIDFGYTPTAGNNAVAGGLIWQDIPVNDVVDGVYDPAAEPTIGNVTLNLIEDMNANGVWDASEPIVATISAPSGDYRFEHLPPGAYLMAVSDTLRVLRNFAPTKLGPNPAGASNNHAQPYEFYLDPGEAETTVDFGYREFEVFGQGDPPNPGMIGDQIWLDMNNDGVYSSDDSDLPIADVTVQLSQGGAAVATTTTGTDGRYLFTDLASGSYSVTVTDDFDVLANYVPAKLGPNPGLENNNQAQPYDVTLGFNPINTTADFGYHWPETNYIITQTLNTPELVRMGAAISFTVVITNTGAGWITSLPLRETYDPAYLRYVDATTAPDDSADDGQLDWGDLTTVFDDLAPGASIEVTIEFDGAADTTALPDGRTPTTASVQGASADPDGIGPLSVNDPLSDASAAGGVSVADPTGVEFAAIAVTAEMAGNRIAWTTASELTMIQFNILRALPGDGYEIINPEAIAARYAGADQGASYAFLDKAVQPGATYHYMLQVIHSDGRRSELPLPAVTTHWRLSLPLVVKK